MRRLLAINGSSNLLLTIVTLPIVNHKDKKLRKFCLLSKLWRDADMSGGGS